ncbi:MAG: acylphosphatase [Planctomycetales bacterium]|nr:acylphosphatase [Planctomycetales bacterium]
MHDTSEANEKPLVLHLRFRGRVQGVGFRATVLALSGQFTVTGRVWNCWDGSVGATIEGGRVQVNGLRDRILESMRRNIEEWTQQEESAMPKWSDFRIGPDQP